MSNDLPKLITQEFGPELAEPVGMIINNIFQSGEWPHHWKLEYVVPIGKTPVPESEDDLRPISLTPFFTKVLERFVLVWLMSYLEDKLDFRQYGGLKGNSITHYINFILSCQDSNDQTPILACLVDFSKAFDRQNHKLLITKLSDMGVPAWLLKIVSLESPAGPQGTLLGLFLFIS